MCGIVGAVAQRDVAAILIEGLKRLEYRGYDSAGIAVITPKKLLERHRSLGKVRELENLLIKEPLTGTTGIAHTRWATHGKPSEDNAHPLTSHDRIALVHNGIIENHEALREKLLHDGYKFNSETDTEIVAHLLHKHLQQDDNLLKAVQKTVKLLEGAYALAIIDIQNPHRLIAVRSGSPLVVGLGIGENFVASDQLALLPVAQQFIYLDEGDVVDVERQKITIYDHHDQIATRHIRQIDAHHDTSEKGQYRHYMLKEIFEQPDAISTTLEGRLSRQHIAEEIFGTQAAKLFSQTKHIQIAACGTSFHAGLVARYWIEELTGLSCDVETASELRYRHNVVAPNTLFVTLSQSGETADTLAAQKQAKAQGYIGTLTICNVAESALVRDADLNLMMHAGPEIGVASTKAFTSQLVCLLLLTIVLGKRSGKINDKKESFFIDQLRSLPKKIEQVLELNKSIEKLAKQFADKQHTLFVGRGTQYPIALEGALKLKEISYIHAEGYPAGELKHGPLALLDEDMPVIALAPQDELLEKLKSNLQVISARGAKLIVFTDPQTTDIKPSDDVTIIPMPSVDKIIAPILYTIPLQLLAYYVAILKGTDVDQPRNLAKSVTVE